MVGVDALTAASVMVYALVAAVGVGAVVVSAALEMAYVVPALVVVVVGAGMDRSAALEDLETGG